MMQQRPVIAILTANVLVGVGLRSILEKAAPAADVELFGNFQEFAEADPERFIHYFVTAQLFAAHNAFFRARSHRTIVLANGQTPAGVHCIDVQTDEERFVRSLMRLQHSVRRPEHALPVQPQAAQPLTEREAEVLTLIAGGLINKQVADPAGNRPDDRDLPPSQHHGEARHPHHRRAGGLRPGGGLRRSRRDVTRLLIN